jgi:hypothetical protein
MKRAAIRRQLLGATRGVISIGALLSCATAAMSAEIRVEGEAQKFFVSSIGARPLVGAGADVDNSLKLEGLGPAFRVGLTLGASRRLELRYRRLEDDNPYATAVPDLVLNGEQRAQSRAIDLLLVQRLGRSPFRLEAGYRHYALDRYWQDAVSSGRDLYTLDSNSHVTGDGLRVAIGLDLRFLKVLHLDAALGHSFLFGHEDTLSLWNGPDEGPSSLAIDGGHNLGLDELQLGLRCDVGPRAWLAVGYRYDVWQGAGDDAGEFSAGGMTFAVGFRLGGH